LRNHLAQFGSVDAALFASYDQFANELDGLATEMQQPGSDQQERGSYARHVVDDFIDELRSAQSDVRDIKAKVVSLI